MRLSIGQVFEVALAAGFPAATAVKMAAIAMRESAGETTAHNAKPPDDSYGLWQINMLGALGVERRRQLGISSNDALFDPATNARAAKMIWNGNDANLDRHWYINRNSPLPYKDRYEANLPAAQAYAASRGLVTPAAPPGGGVTFQVAPPGSPLPLVLIPLAVSGKASPPPLAWVSVSSDSRSSLTQLPDSIIGDVLRQLVAGFGEQRVAAAAARFRWDNL